MDEKEFIKEPLEDETGTEVVDDFAQNIPGTAPSFDTMTEEELRQTEVGIDNKNDNDDEDTYKATSINNINNYDSEKKS